MGKKADFNVNEVTETKETGLTTVETQGIAEIYDDSGDYALFSPSAKATFSSLVAETFEEKIAFYNAINNPTYKLSAFINMEIEVKHVYAEQCEYIDRENGDVVDGVRIVLIAADGTSYNTSSRGVFSCLSKIFTIFGHPMKWQKPIKVRVKQISPSQDRKVLILEMV